MDEEGAEAAASTGVAVVTRAVLPDEPVVMTVNRPFQLAVLHPFIRSHQTQIVDYDQIQALLHHQPAAPAAQL